MGKHEDQPENPGNVMPQDEPGKMPSRGIDAFLREQDRQRVIKTMGLPSQTPYVEALSDQLAHSYTNEVYLKLESEKSRLSGIKEHGLPSFASSTDIVVSQVEAIGNQSPSATPKSVSAGDTGIPKR